MIYCIAGFVIVMAYWKNDYILFLVSGIITILAAFELIGNYEGNQYIGVTMILIPFGIYQLINAVTMILTSGGPSKGWSQFKVWYNQVKGGS